MQIGYVVVSHESLNRSAYADGIQTNHRMFVAPVSRKHYHTEEDGITAGFSAAAAKPPKRTCWSRSIPKKCI